jgi:hypothetical protein
MSYLQRLSDSGRALGANDLPCRQELANVRRLQELLQLLTLASFHSVICLVFVANKSVKIDRKTANYNYF